MGRCARSRVGWGIYLACLLEFCPCKRVFCVLKGAGIKFQKYFNWQWRPLCQTNSLRDRSPWHALENALFWLCSVQLEVSLSLPSPGSSLSFRLCVSPFNGAAFWDNVLIHSFSLKHSSVFTRLFLTGWHHVRNWTWIMTDSIWVIAARQVILWAWKADDDSGKPVLEFRVEVFSIRRRS